MIKSKHVTESFHFTLFLHTDSKETNARVTRDSPFASRIIEMEMPGKLREKASKHFQIKLGLIQIVDIMSSMHGTLTLFFIFLL